LAGKHPLISSAENQDAPLYDVVVVGGSLSGAATAVLLLRKNPGLKLLIVEKSTHFTRRVGEATVEVSAFFLGRMLGMTQHLNESHLVKQGMRFWFTNDEAPHASGTCQRAYPRGPQEVAGAAEGKVHLRHAGRTKQLGAGSASAAEKFLVENRPIQLIGREANLVSAAELARLVE